MVVDINDMKLLLDEVADFGVVIYFLYKEKKVSVKDIKDMFFKSDNELRINNFQKIIANINNEDFENAFKYGENYFTKINCIDRVIDTKEHLKSIKDIALTNSLADIIIKDDTYIKYLNITYLYLLFEELNTVITTAKDNRLIKKYLTLLDIKRDANDIIINKNIDSYYLRKVGA